jgi:hypothetical protein
MRFFEFFKSTNREKLYSLDECLEQIFLGILKREPDPESHRLYKEMVLRGEKSLPELMADFLRLNEAIDANTPLDPLHAIAKIYAGNSAAPLGNPNIWNHQKFNLVFFHLPKTAGTSLLKYICSKYHPLQLGQTGERQQIGRLNMGIEQKFFSWHMSWSEFEEIPKPVKSIIFVRDPKARLISLYKFLASLGSNAEGKFKTPAVIAAGASFTNFLSSNKAAVINVTNNALLRDLTDCYVTEDDHDPLISNERHFVELAISRLKSFDYRIHLDALRQPSKHSASLLAFKNFASEVFDEKMRLDKLEVLNTTPDTNSSITISSELIHANSKYDTEILNRVFDLT